MFWNCRNTIIIIIDIHRFFLTHYFSVSVPVSHFDVWSSVCMIMISSGCCMNERMNDDWMLTVCVTNDSLWLIFSRLFLLSGIIFCHQGLYLYIYIYYTTLLLLLFTPTSSQFLSISLSFSPCLKCFLQQHYFKIVFNFCPIYEVQFCSFNRHGMSLLYIFPQII